MALVLGALTPLALPPLHWVPVLAITFPALLWLLDGVRGKAGAFALGWGFGTGFFASGLYWIANALLVDAERFGWLVPFAIGGLGLGLGLFLGFVTLGVWLSRTAFGGRLLVFASLWTLFEILRGWIFTGFPWNLIGTVWADTPAMIQGASFIGTYGLSLLTVLIFSTPALLAWSGQVGKERRFCALIVLLSFGLLPAAFVLGQLHLNNTPTSLVDDVWLRLVQPNIPQAEKWKRDKRMENLGVYMTLSMAKGVQPPTHVIWGETAVPYAINGVNDHSLRAALGESLSEARGISPQAPPLLITGAIRTAGSTDETFQMFNSLIALDGTGDIQGLYDKSHLVPFGEYMPLRTLIPLKKITAGSIDYTPGSGLHTLTLPGLPPVSPLICYEVIFPGAVALPPVENQRPAWLLNLTNDGWYGLSAGPYQHYATSRLRAVEEGLPLVRVANTGISAIVDPQGREIVRLELGQKGYIDGPLPQPTEPTLFAILGNIAPLILALTLILVGLMQGRREARRLASRPIP